MDALIGHTGFVGSNLAKQHDFGFNLIRVTSRS